MQSARPLSAHLGANCSRSVISRARNHPYAALSLGLGGVRLHAQGPCRRFCPAPQFLDTGRSDAVWLKATYRIGCFCSSLLTFRALDCSCQLFLHSFIK